MTDIPYSTSNTIELNLNIGFAQYADLIREEAIKQGFNLNLLFMGRRGLGTKTLINSLFSIEIINTSRNNSLETITTTLTENNINLNLEITTYHEFDSNSLKIFFDNKNKQFLELNSLSDTKCETRIHGCIFLLPSDELTEKEIDCLLYLSNECNLIPVMAKSDCYTIEELRSKRQTYKELFELKKIHTFAPPIFSHSDERILQEKEEIENKMPLAVIASEELIKEGDSFLRVREYNWGTVYITKEATNDFMLLRKILISQNSMDLIYLTEKIFYNKFKFFYNKNKKNEEVDLLKRVKELRIKIERRLHTEKELSSAESLKDEEFLKDEGSVSDVELKDEELKEKESAVKLVIESSSVEESSLESVTQKGVEKIRE